MDFDANYLTASPENNNFIFKNNSFINFTTLRQNGIFYIQRIAFDLDIRDNYFENIKCGEPQG